MKESRIDATYMKQLALMKYLFGQGEKSLDARSAMACGVAISHFQDAVEMLLWTAIKEKNLKCKNEERASLADMWDVIDNHLRDKGKELPLHACMIELNKARVNFKHYGNLPASSDAKKFLAYTRQFLVDATQAIFGKDFESVSLVNLIQDEQIRGILMQAEHHFARGEHSECMEKCAKAHELASRFLIQMFPRMCQSNLITVEYGDPSRRSDFVDLGSYLNILREISLAAILDIPANDFFRYAALDPNRPLAVRDIFGRNSVSATTHPQTTECPEDGANFALRYVTEYALAVQEHIGG